MNNGPNNRPKTEDSVTRDPPDRALIFSWVLVSDFGSYVKTLKMKVGGIPEDADTGIGYVYIDHDAGISMAMEYLGKKNGEELPGTSLVWLDNLVSLRFRYSSLKLLNLKQLTREEITRLELPEIPDRIRFYETPDIRTIRELEWLDPFRAKGFFDDVMAVLPRIGENVPELIWVRLMRYDVTADRFLGTLLNEPFRDYGIHRGDTLEIQTIRDPRGIQLAALPKLI
jgi:hypothetical protein